MFNDSQTMLILSYYCTKRSNFQTVFLTTLHVDLVRLEYILLVLYNNQSLFWRFIGQEP